MAKLIETRVVGKVYMQLRPGGPLVLKPVDKPAEIVEYKPSEVVEMPLVGTTPFSRGDEPTSVRVVRITEVVKAPPIRIVG